MVKCPRCGYDNVSSATYCENCSYILNGSPTGQKGKGWNMGTAKKIVLIVGIIVIAFLLFSFIYDATRPSYNDTINVIEADSNVQEGSNFPYQVKIVYDGKWYGKVGDPNYLQEKSGSGNEIIGLDCASWDRVGVDISKDDYSSSELSVQLLKNGDVVAENSTTKAMGHVTISYN